MKLIMRGVRRWNEGGEVGWNRIGEEVGKLKKIGEGGGGGRLFGIRE